VSCSACPSYRFLPAFFIRSAYAALARIDAARRMAGVHRGRLRAVWFGVGVVCDAGTAFLGFVTVCGVPCKTAIALFNLSRSAMSNDMM
jgi:hypothetical protein